MESMADDLHKWISEVTGISSDTQNRLLATLIVIVVLWLIQKLISGLVLRRKDDPIKKYRWRKSLSITIYILSIIIIGDIWINQIRSMATFFGLVSAGLAIALRDPLVNLAGWAFILIRKPFEAGDRIQIGEFAGDVIDIRLYQFTMIEIRNWVDADQSTGRLIHVPNSKVFSDVQANYTTGFPYIWNEIPVLITFESDWEKAKEILVRIVNEKAEHISKPAETKIREAAKRFLIVYRKLTPIVYTDVRDFGVLLTMRYLCDARTRRTSQENIWEAVLAEFAKHKDIDFAYPTTRFYDNREEGKQAPEPKN